MRWLSNIRIAIKLAAMSGLGILLVAGMLISQMLGNAAVKSSSAGATLQQSIEVSTVMVKASVRGLMIGVRDVRLAQTAEAMKKATDYVNERYKSLIDNANTLLSLVTLPENRERAQKIKALADQYLAGATEIAKLRGEANALGRHCGPRQGRQA